MKKKKKLNKIKYLIFIFFVFLIIIVTINALKHFRKGEIVSVSQTEENKDQNNTEKQESEENLQKQEEKTLLEKKLETGKLLGENGLPVLMYHFFYDSSKGEKGADTNWIEISKFEEQMKYLSENDFYFPTWKEVEDYIDGIQKLPEKSIVITVDDGDSSFFELAVPIIQKYNIQATSFIVTYWYGDRAENKEKNISYQSHSNDMHKSGSGSKGVMLSWSYEKIKEDLVVSSQILGGANIFCYPFGQYNETDIRALQDTGFKLAFTTKARKSTNWK